jgi:SAM-dependent methyltransferase
LLYDLVGWCGDGVADAPAGESDARGGSPMRTYTADKYQSLVEETRDPRLQNFMDKERAFVARTPGAHRRTFVDLGAGHGRVVGDLARLGRNVVALEINPDMYAGLAERAASYPNVRAVHGDILELGHLLAGEDLAQPVFLILQNSLGTIEGDYGQLLRVVRSQMLRFDGQLVLSLCRQPALRDWGLEMYASLREMVGDADPDATDTSRGTFVTSSGYTSKWWSDAEIEQFRRLGHVDDELVEDEFHLLRLGNRPS